VFEKWGEGQWGRAQGADVMGWEGVWDDECRHNQSNRWRLHHRSFVDLTRSFSLLKGGLEVIQNSL
jgi:hypothetical protein